MKHRTQCRYIYWQILIIRLKKIEEFEAEFLVKYNYGAV
jgi:hypothetical protein